jgi:hypothetical protein
MDTDELRKLLHQLHDEIEATQTVDEKGGELLRDLDRDIRALLERSDQDLTDEHRSLIQNLEGTLNHFEVAHPSLTLMISRLMDSLSSAGI